MAIRKVSGSTAINRGVNAAVGTLPNMAGVINSVTIGTVTVTDASYNALDDTAVSSSGGFLKITGTGFKPGCTVYIGGSPAASTTYVSPTEVRATTSVLASNTYLIYVLNTDNTIGIKLNALVVSGTPSWNTSATLSDVSDGISFSIQLSATSDSTVTYSLAAGSSVPSGTTLHSNGLFTGTVSGLTSDTTYSFTVNAIDVELQDTGRTFSVTVGVGDINFRITPLLIDGDSTTWLTDASSNNNLTTVFGNTIPTAFSPYNTNWSTYFAGDTSGITYSGTSLLTFGTNPYTIEFWFYGDPSVADYKVVIHNSTYALYFNTSSFQVWNGASPVSQPTLTTQIPKFKWTFLQVIRSSTSAGGLSFYIDGVLVSSGQSDATNWTATGTTLTSFQSGFSRALTGYMADLRVSGVARTPGVPTSRLTSDADTRLLTFQNRRFVDNGPSGLTVTPSGNTAIRSFGPLTETDTATGSGYFDGSGDYLTIPANSAFTLGTNDHCIEFWLYADGSQNQYSVPWYYNGSIVYYFTIGSDAGGNVQLLVGGGSPWSLQITTGQADYLAMINDWTHVAITRSGSAFRIFLNGVLRGYGTTAQSISAQTSAFVIGWDGVNATTYFKGYLNDFKITNGSIPTLYQTSSTTTGTTIFTPPSSSVSVSSNTVLLTLQNRVGHDNNTLIDESGNKYLSNRGGNVTQGSFSPFSPAGWSALFDGSGDYLTVVGSSNLAFGLEDFTIECFFFTRDASTSGFIYDSRTAGNQAAPCIFTGGGVIQYYVSGATRISSAIVANRWYHVVVSRVSGNTRMFLDGSQAGSTYVDATNYINNTNRPVIGTNDAIDFWFNGYISNLRVIKGNGVTSVTVPTAPLTAVANTQLLMLQNNRFRDNSTNGFTINQNGDARIQAFSPFRATVSYSPNTHGGSAYFDGTGDVIQSRSTTTMPIINGTSNTFTIDGWIYPTTSGTKRNIVGDMQSAGGTLYIAVNITTGESIQLQWFDGASKTATSTGLVVKNQWNYFAVVVNNNAITIFVNSTTAGQSGTTTLTNRGGNIGWALGGYNSSEYFTGFMHGIRWTTGTARTISSIPTAPPTPDKDTTLLLNFTGGGVFDETGRHNFETLGNARITNRDRKFGTGSLYFDGSGDGLYQPYNHLYAFGTGDFTIEFWINQAVKTGIQSIVTFGYVPIIQNGWTVQTGNGDGNIIFYYHTSGGAQVAIATESGSTVNTGTWYHIAVVRTGGNTRIYRNGTQVATGADSINYNPATTAGLYIGGGSYINFGDYYLNGYLDDLRITRGARYTGNFTPPTTFFPTK